MAENGIFNIVRSTYDGRMRGKFPGGDFPGVPVTIFRMYISGHSLATHTDDTPPNSAATDYTHSPEWCALFAEEEGDITFTAGGNFGQITGLNTAWSSTYTGVGGSPAFDEIQYTYVDNTETFYPSGTFAAQDFTHFLFMASNFEQESESNDPSDWQARTLTLLDNLNGQESGAEFVMYIHWPEPDMALDPNPVDNTDLTSGEQTLYWSYTRGDYLAWHQDWLQLIRVARPSYNIRAIPVGPIIGDLWENESYMSTVAWTEIIGDSAGHMTEGGYALAGLITYIALRRTVPDLSSFSMPGGVTAVPSEISNNWVSIASYIEERLAYYEDQGLTVY